MHFGASSGGKALPSPPSFPPGKALPLSLVTPSIEASPGSSEGWGGAGFEKAERAAVQLKDLADSPPQRILSANVALDTLRSAIQLCG